ncbi:Protoporphyrinogen oxidase [Orchesella cincta]|uniref:Protoporphyrinogen oxidase n=1 Tax=Orchesella cincta TaxID=48709 RepID=A0A1D2MFC1_ORCCI|nr:Protoporphyrinogen oxidase [Orchesella cincta]
MMRLLEKNHGLMICRVFQHCYSTSTVTTDRSPGQRKVVGIIGGGITGLSAAYYLVKQHGDKVLPVVFEKADRVGGWVKTVITDKGSRYEIGPRSIRPAGIRGMNTLDMVEDLGLHHNLLYVEKTHPTAQNRYIYLGGKLIKLPTSAKVLYKRTEPFKGPLFWSILRDLVKFRKKGSDDSIYNFMSRRFGSEIADYLADPLIRGVCAGDAKKISVKFLMKEMFEHEQNYGSVVLGHFLSKFRKQPCTLSEDDKTIGFSNVALASLSGNWSIWSLEQGLEMLPKALEDYLVTKNNIQLLKSVDVDRLRLTKDLKKVEVKYGIVGDVKRSDTIVCDHIISCIPAPSFAHLLRHSKPSYPDLWKVFHTIEGESLQVTGLTYNESTVMNDAFGFLVPSCEKSVQGLLGVVFDSNVFPQEQNTVLSVMSKPGIGINEIKELVSKTLGIHKEPHDYLVHENLECIPQYTIGHYEKVTALRQYIAFSKLPFTLAGASYDGVSVNDCIYSARQAVRNIVDYKLGFSDS